MTLYEANTLSHIRAADAIVVSSSLTARYERGLMRASGIRS